MKISEIEAILAKAKADHGDLDVYATFEYDYGVQNVHIDSVDKRNWHNKILGDDLWREGKHPESEKGKELIYITFDR